MWNWQQFVSFIRTLKGRKREPAAFAIAALCFPGGYAVGGKLLPDSKDGLDFSEYVQIGLYLVGVLCLAYTAFRVWRLAHPPELPPVKDRPSAIKGPMPFTEADGELFRKLGRESELQKLLGLVLDDQVLMIVVRGASGAGKTSLLRAGLKHILKNGPDSKDVQFHYWEAVPTEADKGLLRAVQEKWPEGATKPSSLDELVNPADALGRQSHVIVLDQFEQLRGSRKIFSLLRRIIRESKPPHRITWVIAFREEFFSDWMKSIASEYERGFHPPLMFLGLFTEERAREVIGQLISESNLKDSIEQSVINNLVEAATVESEVSPVDIGIGLLVLAELHERQSGQTITIRDYQFAGGAEGLLTQYISRCLDLFPKENQEAILKAMLALRDAETNQRLGEGLTVAELAAESGAEARQLKTQLDRLSHRDTRLLETVAPADGSAVRYRLPHERLVPALYRLTGKLLAEVDQAKLKFQNAFQAWKTNNKRRHYLLKAKELRLVERYETQISWGNDEQEKKHFLFRSKRNLLLVRVATVTVGLVLAAIGWVSVIQYQRGEGKRYLRQSGYPPELYDYQYQLKKLELTEPLNLEGFTWLSSDSVEELLVKATGSSNSITGLTSLSKCLSLKKLTLDLSGEDSTLSKQIPQVSDLRPLEGLKGLTQLTIDLSNSRVGDLKPLEQLNGLTQLTLDLGDSFGRSSQVRDLRPLEQLKGLRRLTLDLSGSQVRDLMVLEQLEGLSQLTLILGDDSNGGPHEVRDLRPLERLKRLTQLTLDLGDDLLRSSQVDDLRPLEQLKELTRLALNLGSSQVRDLKPLESLKGLKRLALTRSSSQVKDLKPLEQLKGLTQLTLDYANSQLSDLKLLEQLKELTQLTLSLRYSHVNDLKLLEQLKALTQLTIDLTNSQANDLEPLKQLRGLTQLTLDLSRSQVKDLQPLEQLQRLIQLTLSLRESQVSDLKALEQLKGLTKVTLDLRNSQVKDLKPLEQLQEQTHLTLALSHIQASDLKWLEQLRGLTELTLDLSGSQVSDLRPLDQLKAITKLTIDLGDKFGGTSKVKDLGSLSRLPNLRSLSIIGATTEQRRSLRKIPPSLVELKF